MIKQFPILWGYRMEKEVVECKKLSSFLVLQIPWDMIDTPENRKLAMNNHSQTLSRLAERGGLGVSEAMCIFERKDWYQRKNNCAEDNAALAKLMIIYNANKEKENESQPD